MADRFAVSDAGVAEALKVIEKKKDALSTAITEIAAAFTNTAQNNQLTWLKNLINEEWNSRGQQKVNNANTTMSNFMRELHESVGIAEVVSDGQ